MNYNYEEFLEDLGMGREIHFIYRDENYYIGCGTGQFMFCKINNPSSEIIGEDVEQLLRKINFNGKPIKEVWNLIKIDTIF